MKILTIWFSNKVISNKNNNSKLIINISVVSIFIGLLISVITLSIGIESKNEIRNKISSLNGHLNIHNIKLVNISSKISPITNLNKLIKILNNNTNIKNIHFISKKPGIILFKNDFEGILFKGIDSNYNSNIMKSFMISGNFMRIKKNYISKSIIISEKLSKKLNIKLKDNVLISFINKNNNIIYRKFKVIGIYKTDISIFDDNYIIGDIKIIRDINKYNKSYVEEIEVFLKNIQNINSVKSYINNNTPYNIICNSFNEIYKDINDWLNLFDKNIIIILTIILIVISINISSIMIILIIERSYMIGVLKSLGARNWQIRKIFIYNIINILRNSIILGNIISLSIIFIQKKCKLIKLPSNEYFLSFLPMSNNYKLLILPNILIIVIIFISSILPSYIICNIKPTVSQKIQ